jgi:3-methyladenine DNA glycosylase AlkD
VPTQKRLLDTTEVIAALRSLATPSNLEGMARYAIPSDRAFGVAMRDIQGLAKKLGHNHDLALALWKTGWYEARTLTAYVDEPAKVTKSQMDEWCSDFDNWAICDTLCFALFDRTPHAWTMAEKWATSKKEFVKRASFAMVWGLSVHDKSAPDATFLKALEWIEKAAADERHFVKKAVNMALRATGKRNPGLRKASIAVARRLAGSEDPAPRWIGKDALRELSRAKQPA